MNKCTAAAFMGTIVGVSVITSYVSRYSFLSTIGLVCTWDLAAGTLRLAHGTRYLQVDTQYLVLGTKPWEPGV